MSIYVYKGGQYCPHCMWINQTYLNNNLSVIEDPIFSFTHDKLTGANVYATYRTFPYTFSVILQDHLSYDIHSLLINVLEFVDVLHTIGIHDIRVLINSSYKNNLQEKEHLHAFVTMDSKKSKEKFDAIFNTTRGTTSSHPRKIRSKPYPGDTVHKLRSNATADLFMEEDVVSYLSTLFPLTPMTSFYIFIQMHSLDNKKCLHGKLSAQIAH